METASFMMVATMIFYTTGRGMSRRRLGAKIPGTTGGISRRSRILEHRHGVGAFLDERHGGGPAFKARVVRGIDHRVLKHGGRLFLQRGERRPFRDQLVAADPGDDLEMARVQL